MSEGQIPDGLEHPMWRTPPEPWGDEPPTPPLAVEIASLVQGYIDDKVNELRFEVQEAHSNIHHRLSYHEQSMRDMQATMGGLRDGVAERLEGIEGQLNLPEHVYKNFIKSEAERLRIVKPRVTPDTSQ